MIGTRYIFIYAGGDVRFITCLHDPHAIQIAKTLPDVIRVTEDDGRPVWTRGR